MSAYKRSKRQESKQLLSYPIKYETKSLTACLTDVFVADIKLIDFEFFYSNCQITYSKTVKFNQICYSPGYLCIFTGFSKCPLNFWVGFSVGK